MTAYYPLKAVVTSNSALAADYNQHDISVFLTSGCLSPEEFGLLINGGAQFESVVLVDGAGEQLVKKLADGSSPELTIDRVAIGDERSLDEAIKKIHSVFGCSGNRFDVGG